jgi:hypothetical protein
VNNKRHGLSVISTVTNKGQMRWKAYDGALNSDILIDSCAASSRTRAARSI